MLSFMLSLASATAGELILKDVIKISYVDFYCAWRPGDGGRSVGTITTTKGRPGLLLSLDLASEELSNHTTDYKMMMVGRRRSGRVE